MINAHVRVTLIDAAEDLPQFTSPLYSFAIAENATVDTAVGQVEAQHRGKCQWGSQFCVKGRG